MKSGEVNIGVEGINVFNLLKQALETSSHRKEYFFNKFVNGTTVYAYCFTKLCSIL
jgi:hypothetical protein